MTLLLAALLVAAGPASPELHQVFQPSPAQVQAAARLGEQAVERRMTEDELLDLWSRPVPGTDGRVAALVPAARVAAAAFEARKYYRDAQTRQREIAQALAAGRQALVFRVTLKSKGSGNWLWPAGVKSGDRKALESIRMVLAVDSRYYQPGPEQTSIEGQPRVVGSPIPVATTVNVGSVYFSLPILSARGRTEFTAHYQVDFPMNDKDGRPLITTENRQVALKIIGARDEKQVVFELASLEKLPRLGGPAATGRTSVTPWRD